MNSSLWRKRTQQQRSRWDRTEHLAPHVFLFPNCRRCLIPSEYHTNYAMLPPTKWTRLSFKKKLDIANTISSGQCYADLDLKYCIKKPTLCRIKREASTLREKSTQNLLSSNLKSVCELRYQAIDYTVLKFVAFCRKASKPVTRPNLSARKLIVRDKPIAKSNCNEETTQCKTFEPSLKWGISFAKCHGLGSVALHGEKRLPSAYAVAQKKFCIGREVTNLSCKQNIQCWRNGIVL